MITYTGANEHTGSDAAAGRAPRRAARRARRTTAGDAAAVREQVLVHHPLQPFDARNLLPGRAGRRAAVQLRPVRAGGGAGGARRARAGTTLARRAAAAAADRRRRRWPTCRRSCRHPVRAFLRSRLDVTAPLEAEETARRHPAHPRRARAVGIGDRHAQRRCSPARTHADVVRAERLRGQLPPGALGGHALQIVKDQSAADRADLPAARGRAALLRRRRRPRRWQTSDGHGRAGVRATGWCASSYSGSPPSTGCGPGWTCSRSPPPIPTRAGRAHAVGRGRAAAARDVALRSTTRAAASGCARLVDLYDRGMREPLPMPPKTACAYAEGTAQRQRRGRRRPAGQARREWETDRFSATESPARTPMPAPRAGVGRARTAASACSRAGTRSDERWTRRAAPARAARAAAVGPAARRRGAGEPPVSEQPAAFDIRDPLPTGTTLLEASAGTGKTWTIARAGRRVASPRAWSGSTQMLIVTFGRAASQRAARARAQPAGRGRARARRPGVGARAERPGRAAPRRRRGRAEVAAPAAARRARRLRRRDDRHHPPVLPPRAPRPRRGGRHRLRRDGSSRTSTTCWPRSSTTSTYDAYGDVDGEPLLSHAEALRLPGRD